MGPPTISAEQLQSGSATTPNSSGFNGAADDLGGATLSDRSLVTWLDRRFNGAADDLGGATACASAKSWPCAGFNGAADDLGGATT
ncbi:hypothetical protein TC41_0038 [Alicyclobacillus acidocaldarius subsp. acidocaldarius Tc-4-1]|uniref:Uncharacterized protein n=1 Tax=Alicyclobacillus acidocaldarius (strain Tc-4-1) TaxID=1048834 RepID=F8IHQ1_ALIAT|nr:hypothetical protein TC41_0038 [Alicyclobacillus acidocaldarius subsp. acidocaldarius Tc-4-1]